MEEVAEESLVINSIFAFLVNDSAELNKRHELFEEGKMSFEDHVTMFHMKKD